MKFDDFDTQITPEENEQFYWEEVNSDQKPYFDYSPNQADDGYADYEY